MIDDTLASHIASSANLAPSLARRVIEDVLAYHNESAQVFIERRHTELQADGIQNKQIFEVIQSELRNRLVQGPDLTVRQLRRLIYGG